MKRYDLKLYEIVDDCSKVSYLMTDSLYNSLLLMTKSKVDSAKSFQVKDCMAYLIITEDKDEKKEDAKVEGKEIS